VVDVRRERASWDGWNSSECAASITAARVRSDSSPRPFKAREAVDEETPARRATSARVAI
jgi:hypothetical protein